MSFILFNLPPPFLLKVPTKPVSPYGSYNGQIRSCVYQPTEIALIAKGLTRVSAFTIFNIKKHVLLFTSEEKITCLHVSTDGPVHDDPSSLSPLFEPSKWQLPSSFSRVLIV